MTTTYTTAQAHADGRHASPSILDREFWAATGCTDCLVLVGGHLVTLPGGRVEVRRAAPVA